MAFGSGQSDERASELKSGSCCWGRPLVVVATTARNNKAKRPTLFLEKSLQADLISDPAIGPRYYQSRYQIVDSFPRYHIISYTGWSRASGLIAQKESANIHTVPDK